MHSQNNRCKQVLMANSTQKWKEYCAQNTKSNTANGNLDAKLY